MSAPICIAHRESLDRMIIHEAARFLRGGKLVVVPTETVYGIAADMKNPEAMARLIELKKRPDNKPFSLHIADKEQIEDCARFIPVFAYKLVDAFWPGPLTLVLKSEGNQTIGVRMPNDLITRDIIRESQLRIVCPSANLADEPAPNDVSSMSDAVKEGVDLIIDAGPTTVGQESTVVDATSNELKILRQGSLAAQDIDRVAKRKIVLMVCTGNSCRSVMAEALLKQKLEQDGRSDVDVFSAGIVAHEGMSATEATRNVLATYNIDVSNHKSHRLTKWLAKKADLILVMERLHEDRVLEAAPEVKNRLFLLKEFAKMNKGGLDVSDPIGKSNDFYAQTAALIKEAVDAVSKLI